jgi:hypothetical protein
MSAISVNATSVTNVALALTAPIEVEPNDDIAHAQPLTVDGWVAGNVGGADVMDLYSVQIPTLATYTFETSGVLGACGTALEADTRLRLLDATGAQIAVNDNTAFSPASLVTYPGLFCSLISSQLQPGRYFLEIRASAGIGGTYRLHIRSGS